MVERRGGKRFAPQALARDRVLFLVRMEPLDRDAPFEPEVVGEKDLPHPTSAQRGVDAVPASEQIGHRQSDDFFDLVIVGVLPRLVKTAVRLVEHARFYWLWLARVISDPSSFTRPVVHEKFVTASQRRCGVLRPWSARTEVMVPSIGGVTT
jgi:hypothetical protein